MAKAAFSQRFAKSDLSRRPKSAQYQAIRMLRKKYRRYIPAQGVTNALFLLPIIAII